MLLSSKAKCLNRKLVGARLIEYPWSCVGKQIACMCIHLLSLTHLLQDQHDQEEENECKEQFFEGDAKNKLKSI